MLDALPEPKSASQRTYYVVSAPAQETRYADGTVATPAGATIWLGWTNENGGWPSNSLDRAHAKQFDHRPTVKELKFYVGAPWWFKFNPDKVRILKVTETIFDPILVEEEV